MKRIATELDNLKTDFIALYENYTNLFNLLHAVLELEQNKETTEYNNQHTKLMEIVIKL